MEARRRLSDLESGMAKKIAEDTPIVLLVLDNKNALCHAFTRLRGNGLEGEGLPIFFAAGGRFWPKAAPIRSVLSPSG